MPADDKFLPYAKPALDEADIAAVCAILRSDWLTTGPMVNRFERGLVEKVGARFAVACSNGTAALHMAAYALGIEAGDAVVVPTITFLATANAVRYLGGEVIFADVDPETGLIGEVELQEALERTPKAQVKAVFPVHLAGQMVDMTALARVAREHDLKVVEDAAHALGAFHGRSGDNLAPAGACGHSDLSTFSFHAVKTIAMGEGGAVTTNDEHFFQRLIKFRNHGMDRNATEFSYPEQALDGKGERNPWYYEMPDLGYNYRLTDIQCALGLSQLNKLERFVERRRALIRYYDVLLHPLLPFVRPIGRAAHCVPAWHLCMVLIDFAGLGKNRADVMRKMFAGGVGTQVHYIPVHWQPYYRRRLGRQTLPGAESFYARALSLPLYPEMTESDVERVVATLARALGLDGAVV